MKKVCLKLNKSPCSEGYHKNIQIKLLKNTNVYNEINIFEILLKIDFEIILCGKSETLNL